MRFRAEQHLRRQLDFQHVRTHGRRHECGAFTLWYVRQAAPVAVGETKLGENPVVVTPTTPTIPAKPAASTTATSSASSASLTPSESCATVSASEPVSVPASVSSSTQPSILGSGLSEGNEPPANLIKKEKSAARPTPLAPTVSRLGVVASRSAVGNAIARARAKRRLREVFRGHQQRVPAGYDLLLVARGALNRLEYREIEKRFVDACSKIFPSAKA